MTGWRYRTCVLSVLLSVFAGGCTARREPVVKLEHHSVGVSRLVKLFWELPSWPTEERSFSGGEWQQLIDTAAFVQRSDRDEVIEALTVFINDVTTDLRPGLVVGSESKVFLLLRIVFELPEDAPLDERRVYVGWLNWPRGENGRVNLAWPIEWNKGNLRLVDRLKGCVGSPYDAPAEYQHFLAHYGFRQLSHLAAKEE
jgi:hypothetical protein